MATSSSLVSASSTSFLTQTRSLCSLPSSSFKGNAVMLRHGKFRFPRLSCAKVPSRSVVVTSKTDVDAAVVEGERPAVRFRLDNLGPQPGSRKKGKRKGRGISAGQGASCGFGMRGQKSRSGPGVRKGFEGGQMPLYRRIPKLRGIAGGMHAGLPKYIPVNLKDIETAGYQDGEEVSLETLKAKGLIDGEEVSLETLKAKGLINPSGRERRLPLKILGDGELSLKLNIKARSISEAAKEKLEAAGCSLTLLPGRKKWVKPSVARNLARAEEYFAKKRAASAESAPAPP